MNIKAQQRAALIQAVANEVLRRIGLEQTDESSLVERKRVLVLSEEPLPELENLLRPHVELSYYNETLRDCDLLIMPKLCMQLLVNLANGISAGPRERFVLTMLLKGRRVIAVEEGLYYRKYKSSAPVLLYKLYEKCADQLASYGIRLVKQSELLAVCLEDSRAEEAAHASTASQVTPHASAASQAASARASELCAACSSVNELAQDIVSPMAEVLTCRVVTEAEVKKYRLHNGSQIVIDRNSIITPLAQDYLRMQQMQVHRR
ncbi:ethanolamine utilization protein [Paenibacillus sp. 481]|uniref:ethanolamine utilization protein n=1 Tax=Paenibacillus sp. 481 TaxID=2835869 RepID=UPI001E51BFA0|nr:ethanolamine utilization protein [Paenibacillus sp. 481]UHA72528.1 ethanolamine utilization protein [Paenibacillus sp. 481]